MSKKCGVILSVFCVLLLIFAMTASAEWVYLVRIKDLVLVNGSIAVYVQEDGITDARRGWIKRPGDADFKPMAVVDVSHRHDSGVLKRDSVV